MRDVLSAHCDPAQFLPWILPATVLPLLLMFSTATNATQGQSLSPSTYQQLSEIQDHIDRQAYATATSTLRELLRDVTPKSYEEAVALQTLGYLHVSRQDYAAAIRAFEQSLALAQLPDETQQRLRYDLAQLYLAEDESGKAVTILEAWFQLADRPAADAYVLLGHAYAQQQRYRKAIAPLKKAIELAERPQADWYEALLAMHYELRAYRDCAPLLKEMISLFPKEDQYWLQLGGVHLALEEYPAALTALELAYRVGALKKEQELLQLVQLYLYTGIPYKAAQLLQEKMRAGGIKNNAANRELLARAWSSARERGQAVEALENAIGADAKPELRLRLAQWYFEDERWQAAASVLEPLLDGKNGESTDHAWLLLGIARFEQDDRSAARQAFLRAAQSSGTEPSAQQWLEFLDSSPMAEP